MGIDFITTLGGIKMKKSCILLLAMSVISLLIAAFGAVSVIDSINNRSQLSIIDETVENSIALTLAKVAVEVNITISAVISAAALVLGISGIIGSIKRGFSVVCIVLGGLLSAYMLFAVIDTIIRQSVWLEDYVPMLIFAGLYTAGAAVVFRTRKAL